MAPQITTEQLLDAPESIHGMNDNGTPRIERNPSRIDEDRHSNVGAAFDSPHIPPSSALAPHFSTMDGKKTALPRDLTTAEDYAGIVNAFDVILLDCDGVVWEGDHVIDGVHETLKYLRREGKRIFFVTNNATRSREENKKKFDKLGIECHVVSSTTRVHCCRS